MWILPMACLFCFYIELRAQVLLYLVNKTCLVGTISLWIVAFLEFDFKIFV